MVNIIYIIWDFILNQFIAKPQFLLAIIVAIGYILLKKPFTEVLTGAIKTSLGIMILTVGASQMIGTFRPILIAFSEKLGTQGTIIDPYMGFPAALDALGENSFWVGYTILIALGINILLVIVTKMRGVFLTGHVMFQQSTIATAIISYTLGLPMIPTILISGGLTGLYWAVGTNALIKPTNTITNNAGFTIGHQQMFMDWIASKLSHFLGDPQKDDCENIKLPKWLSILNEDLVAMAIIMCVFMIIIMLALGIPKVKEMAGLNNWFIYTLETGLSFAVYAAIILTGVRLFVKELSNSFTGISGKLLKNSVIGVDCPAIFPFSPNAWVLGFIFTTIGEVVAILTLVLFHSPVFIIAGFIPLFFDGGTVGVYANKHGGLKAVIVFGILTGLVQVFGSALMIPMSGMVGGWVGMFDWATIWPAITVMLRGIGHLFGLPVPPYGV